MNKVYGIIFLVGIVHHISYAQTIDERSTRERLTIVEEKMVQFEDRLEKIDQKIEKIALAETPKPQVWKCFVYCGIRESHPNKESSGFTHLATFEASGLTAKEALNEAVANSHRRCDEEFMYADSQGMTGVSVNNACHRE